MKTKAETPKRIARQYRQHLPTIALAFVRSGRCKAETVRAIKIQLPHLRSFKPCRLDCWASNPEWLAALRSAEVQASAEKELPPDVRGAKLLHFAQDALKEIETAYADAKAAGEEKEKKALEDRIIKLHDALRSEERHQDILKTQAALRATRNIVANLVAVAKECETIPDYLRRLAEYARDPAKLLGVTIE